MRTIAFAALAAAAFAVTSPARASTERDWSHSWKVEKGATIRVVTDDARVRIHRGEPGDVSARVHYRSRTWGLTSGESLPKVLFDRVDGAIRIEAREQSNWVVFGGVETKFEMDVTVPPDCDLSVRSGDGSITCDPLSGRITLESGDGRIRCSGLRGTLVLWSGDGGVDADSLDGSLMGRTTDGHLRVAGRFDDLDLRTGDGRLEATVVRGSQLAGGWSLQSGDGSILFRIPRNLRALLDASSRDGGLRVDLPVTTQGRIRDHALYGQLNGGNVPLRIRSGDGSITIGLSE
jgi:hypothetical protein